MACYVMHVQYLACHTKKSVWPDSQLSKEQRWDWRIKGYVSTTDPSCISAMFRIMSRNKTQIGYSTSCIRINHSTAYLKSASNYNRALM